MGVARCASGLIKFQDSLIANISRKNQIDTFVWPLSFFFIHFLASFIKLGFEAVIYDLFLRRFEFIVLLHDVFMISLTHSSGDFQKYFYWKKSWVQKFYTLLFNTARKISMSKIYFWSCWIFWKDKFCILKPTVNYWISQWWLHDIKDILLPSNMSEYKWVS